MKSFSAAQIRGLVEDIELERSRLERLNQDLDEFMEWLNHLVDTLEQDEAQEL